MMDTENIKAALSLADQGFRVLLVKEGGKSPPLQKDWPKAATKSIQGVTDLWKKNPTANIAIACGKESDLIVLDIDVKGGKQGLETLQTLEEAHGALDAPRVKTPSGGLHLYFKAPPIPVGNKVDWMPGIDIRSDGGYVIAPPSVVDGKPYVWEIEGEPTQCLDWLVQLLTETNKVAQEQATPNTPLAGVPKGKRNEFIFKYACALRHKGMHKQEAKVLVLAKAQNCNPALPEKEALTALQSAYNYKVKGGMDVPAGIDALELLNMDLPEPLWIAPPVLPAGLTILAGRPKGGKSWLVLDLGLSVATGGSLFNKLDVEQGGAIVLALEDNHHRLKDRMEKLLGDEVPPPNALHLFTQWPQNGMKQLRDLIVSRPGTKLLVIDTLARFCSKAKANSDLYGKDYDDIAQLKSMADEFGISVLVLHHTRKTKADDPFEMVSGTLGLTGAADTIWVLERGHSKGTATLHVRGRDVEERSLSLVFDSGHWSLFGEFEIPLSSIEMKVIEMLIKAVMTPKEVAEALGQSHHAVSKQLQRMYDKGLIEKVGHGKYTCGEDL